MSVEEAVTDGLQQPMNNNAESAQDVENMLAELKGDSTVEPAAKAAESVESTHVEDQESVAPNDHKPKVETENKPDAPREEPESRAEEDRRQRRNDRGNGRSGRGGRGRGGFQNRNYRDNIKSDFSSAPETNDPVQIRKQVEFYFSDSNLPMDKFLLEQVGGSKNNPVKIETLHSFKRMRRFQPFSAIVAALKESEVLQVVDDDTAVQRKTPLPVNLEEGLNDDAVKIFEDKAMPRSIYAKGFGEEVPSTQFDIEAFFAPYGPTNAIRLRRSTEKQFKGSVFVEFETEDLQKAFLDLDPKPRYKGNDLQLMSKKQYCDQKVDDIKSGKIKPNDRQYDRDRRNPNKSDRRSGNRDHKRRRDDDDDRDWRVRRDEDRKQGFRDDKRRGNRDRDSRGGRGGRGGGVERDDRGIPLVKGTEDEKIHSKQDSATADALANARAAVEAENKKEAEVNGKQETVDAVEETEQGDRNVTQDSANAVEQSVQDDIAAVAGKKRAREEEDESTEREAKKVNT